MTHKTEVIQIEDLSTDIYYQVWQPEKAIKAVMLVCHGLGEHGGRYGSEFADFYTKAGIVIVAPDLPGHGNTKGIRGHIPDTIFFLDIIDKFIALIKHNFPGKPIFLYGHSMGGLITLWHNSARSPKVNGIVITSPALGTNEPVPQIKRTLAKIMDRLLPSFCMDNGLDTNQLSQDKEVVKTYLADPLVHDRISARLGMFILSKGEWVLSKASQNKNPLLVMIGSDEGIVSKDAVDKYCQITPGVDYKVWSNLYHEIHNEPQKEEVFKFTLSWLKKNI